MGLLKGMSDRQGLEQMRNEELGVRNIFNYSSR